MTSRVIFRSVEDWDVIHYNNSFLLYPNIQILKNFGLPSHLMRLKLFVYDTKRR